MAKGREAVNSTNKIGKNQDFNLLTLHTRGQSPKSVTLQIAYMVVFFDPNFNQSNGL